MAAVGAGIRQQTIAGDETGAIRTIPIRELTGGLDMSETTKNCKYPFVPVSDIIAEDPYAGGRKIPRYIHLAWITDSRRGRCLHYLQAQAMEQWKKALPNYSIFFHADEAVESLLKQENWPEFPHLTKVIQCAKMKGAMLIDIWRVLVLYRYGGIYSDLDLFPGPKFTEETIPAEADFFSFSDGWERPSQNTFGMQPGHPAGYYTMLEILGRLLKMDNIANPKLVFSTGPDALKHGYARAFFWDRDRIFEDGLFPGQFNTTARKIGNKQSRGYIITNMDDVVDGTNMTVREKIKVDTGTIHWSQEQAELKHKVPNMHCSDYLYMLERQKKSFTAPPR